MAVSRVIKLQHHRIAQVCLPTGSCLPSLRGPLGKLSLMTLRCIFIGKIVTFSSCPLLLCHHKCKIITCHPTEWTKGQARMQIECQCLGMIRTLKWPVFFQCRTVKITIFGDEGVPVQVDGEAWVQPPGIIKIVHKNRAQMLTRDRVCTANTLLGFIKPVWKNLKLL